MRKLLHYILNRETVAYFLCGVLTVIVNYGVFWLLLRRWGNDQALIFNAVAFFFSTVTAFFTNKVFVFGSKSFLPGVFLEELGLFFAARLFSFLFIEELGLWICTRFLHAGNHSFLGINGVFIAKVLTTGIAIIFNYVFSKFVIFRKKRRQLASAEYAPVREQE